MSERARPPPCSLSLSLSLYLCPTPLCGSHPRTLGLLSPQRIQTQCPRRERERESERERERVIEGFGGGWGEIGRRSRQSRKSSRKSRLLCSLPLATKVSRSLVRSLTQFPGARNTWVGTSIKGSLSTEAAEE
jgi:hypothetical protein